MTTHALPSGFTLSPWPGRFDREGRLYHYAESGAGEYGFEMVRYEPALAPEATLSPPRPERDESFFEGRTARGSHMRARVPFTPRHVWRLSSRGEFWSMWTAELRIRRHRRGAGVDEVVARDAAGPSVTPADRRGAIDDLARFRELGGRLDPDRIPDVKPPVKTFFLDDADRIWVLLTPGAGSDGSVLEVFTPEGTHVKTVIVPGRIASVPTPVVRGPRLAFVERDELGVPRVVLVDAELVETRP